jgi:hypothetical protein
LLPEGRDREVAWHQTIVTRLGRSMTCDIAIQFQDVLGNWITSVTVPNQPPVILNGMKSVAVLCQGRRVRAIDQDGKLADIL